MINFENARSTMVDCQLRPGDVTDYSVLIAFGSVPREHFVPSRSRELAYIDENIAVDIDTTDAIGRFLMEPVSMARMMALAKIEKDDIVLDVGCATGYSTAILSLLCNSVVALESDKTLAKQAEENLTALNYDNAVVVTGLLENGFPGESPYDAIFVGGAVQTRLDTLFSQLKDGGVLVVVEGVGNAGVARLYCKSGNIVSGRTEFNCAVKPLPGFEATEEFTL